jgi:two-component system, OmpR family, response regulator
MKILAIDDNPDILELLDVVITSHNHEFTSANNGKTGLDLIKNNSFDVVLLDLAMPNFTGSDVVDGLIADDILKNNKIILFTASSITDGLIDELISKGVHSCIRKPVDIEFLIKSLESL